uniref:Uncharacterized protein n=1 Tax=Anguilla anguilla TaxID=7936 RepID=A0A0E9Q841_ANGAN
MKFKLNEKSKGIPPVNRKPSMTVMNVLNKRLQFLNEKKMAQFKITHEMSSGTNRINT